MATKILFQFWYKLKIFCHEFSSCNRSQCRFFSYKIVLNSNLLSNQNLRIYDLFKDIVNSKTRSWSGKVISK
jgi:hypothetical protein